MFQEMDEHRRKIGKKRDEEDRDRVNEHESERDDTADNFGSHSSSILQSDILQRHTQQDLGLLKRTTIPPI